MPAGEVIDCGKIEENIYDVVPVDELPAALVFLMKQCDVGRFPNLFLLLKIGCTLSVTSCESEKCFSAVRKLEILNDHEVIFSIGHNEYSLL